MSVAAALAGGLVSSASQLYANQQNIKANDARFGSEVELANTAHQREIADLQAAGLNPILSASGSGAAVPQLGAAQVESIGDKLGDSIQSAGRLAALEIPLKESQVALNSAQAQNLQYDGYLKSVQADAVKRGIDTLSNSADSVEGVSTSVGDWIGDKLGQIYQRTVDDSDRVRQKGTSIPRQVRHWSPKTSEPVRKQAPGRVRPAYVPLSQRKYVPLSERRKK